MPKLRFNIDLRLHYIEITFRGKAQNFSFDNNTTNRQTHIHTEGKNNNKTREETEKGERNIVDGFGKL